MEDQLIDIDLNESPKGVILGIMRWWEKKRILFNLINIAIVIVAVASYLFGHRDTSNYSFGYSFFIQSFFYFIFINICYCAGWGVQLLGYYYFKIQYDSKAVDYVLFIIGSLFTGLVTYEGYLEFLTLY